MSAPAPAALKNAQGPVIVIDEIGSLELERGEGLAPVLPLLADAGDLLLVVRPELVARVAELVPRHAREVVRVTPENREVLAAVVGRLLM
jgi:nucleoside-triphosphatase THEP1